jgi:orotate phosphoribosyltransferase
VDLIPQKRERLKEIIKTQGIFLRDVTLSSNVKSDVYYDIKTVVNSEGSVLIGELMFDKIRKLFPTTKSVGGLESGALPISTAIVFFSNQLSEEGQLNGFFVRRNNEGPAGYCGRRCHHRSKCYRCDEYTDGRGAFSYWDNQRDR